MKTMRITAVLQISNSDVVHLLIIHHDQLGMNLTIIQVDVKVTKIGAIFIHLRIPTFVVFKEEETKH
jgi:hypothetical protein